MLLLRLQMKGRAVWHFWSPQSSVKQEQEDRKGMQCMEQWGRPQE